MRRYILAERWAINDFLGGGLASETSSKISLLGLGALRNLEGMLNMRLGMREAASATSGEPAVNT